VEYTFELIKLVQWTTIRLLQSTKNCTKKLPLQSYNVRKKCLLFQFDCNLHFWFLEIVNDASLVICCHFETQQSPSYSYHLEWCQSCSPW